MSLPATFNLCFIPVYSRVHQTGNQTSDFLFDDLDWKLVNPVFMCSCVHLYMYLFKDEGTSCGVSVVIKAEIWLKKPHFEFIK